MIKRILISVAVVVAALVAVTVGVYNMIGTRIGTRMATGIAEKFVDAEINVGDLDFSVFGSYPLVHVKLTDVEVKSNVLREGDSLLSFHLLDATFNLKEFLEENKVHVPRLTLDSLVGIAYVDKEGRANYDIVKPSETEEDTTVSETPRIFLDSVDISRVRLCYTDDMRGMRAKVDSFELSLADTRYADSLVARLKMGCHVAYSDSGIEMRDVPMQVFVDAKADTTFKTTDAREVMADISAARVEVKNGHVVVGDSAYEIVVERYSLEVEDLERLRKMVPAPYDSLVASFTTGGKLSSEGSIEGVYDSTHYPKVVGDLRLEQAWVEFVGKKDKIGAELKVDFRIDQEHPNDSYLVLKNVRAYTGKSSVKVVGNVKRALGKNPHVEADIDTRLDLTYIAGVLPRVDDLSYGGDLNGKVKARFDVLDAEMGNLKNAYLKADVKVGRIWARMKSKGIGVFGKNATLEAGVNSMQSRFSKQERFIMSRLEMDTMAFGYAGLVKLRASQFNNNITVDKVDQGVPFLRGSLRFKGLKAFVQDTMAIVGNQANVSLTFRQDTIDTLLPILRANVRLDSVMYFAPKDAAMTDSFRLRLSIKPRTRRWRRDQVTGERIAVDQSTRKSVGVDSLMALLQTVADADDPADQALRVFKFDGNVATRLARYSTPYFPLSTMLRRLDLKFTDDTVKLNNAVVRVGRSMVKMDGDLQNVRRYLRRGRTLTANLNVSGKRLNVNEMLNAYYQGEQRMKMSDDLRQAERLGLITPRKLTGDKLIRPQVFERGFQQKVERRRKERMRDPKYLERKMWLDSITGLVEQAAAQDSMALAQGESNIEADVIDSAATFSLFCLPSNLNVNFTSKIDTVRFGNFILNNFTGDVDMKNSTLHLHNVSSQTNVGDLSMNAMYHCDGTSKADVGLDVQGSGVDITNLVNTVTELDSLLPMLRSFQGVVGLDLSAIAAVDSLYNLDLGSLQAATHITGDSLVLMDGETFAEIAKLLFFKKKTKNLIDNISVELFVDRNEMQVLPFMVSMDKYQVAVGGENTLDMKFKYHISVLESPIPIKFGINVSGDLDDLKVGVGKAKYKDKKTITRKGQFANGGVNLRTETQNRLREAIKNSIEAYAEEKK